MEQLVLVKGIQEQSRMPFTDSADAAEQFHFPGHTGHGCLIETNGFPVNRIVIKCCMMKGRGQKDDETENSYKKDPSTKLPT